jgi:hypothetical protein
MQYVKPYKIAASSIREAKQGEKQDFARYRVKKARLGGKNTKVDQARM